MSYIIALPALAVVGPPAAVGQAHQRPHGGRGRSPIRGGRPERLFEAAVTRGLPK